jgi:hypothetical protein
MEPAGRNLGRLFCVWRWMTITLFSIPNMRMPRRIVSDAASRTLEIRSLGLYVRSAASQSEALEHE